MPSGVYERADLKTRFSKFIKKTKTCWVWQGAIRNKAHGYGVFWFNGKNKMAPRMSLFIFERISEDILNNKNLHTDHLCRNRICVNPDHLEIVTPKENAFRGMGVAGQNSRKTKCPKGHPYDRTVYAKSHTMRVCSICSRVSNRRWAEKKKGSPLNIYRKLSKDSVIEIRTSYANTEATCTELSKKYGISRGYICSIINFKQRRNG